MLPCISCDQTSCMGNEKSYVIYKGLLVSQLKAQSSEQKYLPKFFFLRKTKYLRRGPSFLPPTFWLKCLAFHQEDLWLFRHINILNCFVAMDHSVQYLSQGTIIGLISLLVKLRKRWEYGAQLITCSRSAFLQLRARAVLVVSQCNLKKSCFGVRIGEQLVNMSFRCHFAINVTLMQTSKYSQVLAQCTHPSALCWYSVNTLCHFFVCGYTPF